jgi:hypothetical protein
MMMNGTVDTELYEGLEAYACKEYPLEDSAFYFEDAGYHIQQQQQMYYSQPDFSSQTQFEEQKSTKTPKDRKQKSSTPPEKRDRFLERNRLAGLLYLT